MNINWSESIETDSSFSSWLSTILFPDDCFNAKNFAASRTLYQMELQESLLEEAVHTGILPAGFTKSDLNNSVLEATKVCFGHADTKWFHVNIHDGIVRVVEKFGKYSFRYPLIPIYIILNYHKADQGGSTFSGIASAKKEWVLLFDSGQHISVHGTNEFVNSVFSNLEIKNA